MEKIDFAKKIEEMQRILTNKVELGDFCSEEILKLSRELDQLIIEFYLADDKKYNRFSATKAL